MCVCLTNLVFFLKKKLFFFSFFFNSNRLATENHTERIKTLTKHVYKYANERLQTRALLAGVYHDAIHDRWENAVVNNDAHVSVCV